MALGLPDYYTLRARLVPAVIAAAPLTRPGLPCTRHKVQRAVAQTRLSPET